MFNKVYDTGVPELNIVAYMFENLRDDLRGRGCRTDDTPPALAGLNYGERVILERRLLKDEARRFLDTEDFDSWALMSGADPELLREDMLHEYAVNS